MVRVPQLCRDYMTPREGTGETVTEVRTDIHAALLVAKLHSEAEEIARDLTNPEEYADLIETLQALAKLNGVSFEAIGMAIEAKRVVKGPLERGLLWTPREYVGR